jgi:alginate O-acetyltransferase complex protein AlgI
MGLEIRTPVTSRLAPHRRYAPAGRHAPPASSPDEDRRGLYAGEPETCRRAALPFLRSMVQLGLLLAIFQRYQIEGRAFLALATLSIGALPFHYLAPYRWKKPLFAAISIGGLFWVFGTEVGAIVLGLASAVIGICSLRVSWTARAAGLATLAAALAALRSQTWITAIPSTVWPVLATLFMFRAIIYMYELKHAKAPETLADTVGYFFMLPNFSFMHFPVVDYRTFQRGYFASDVHAIQRRGLEMMFRGTIHLLCYRLVYHELLIPAADVQGFRALAGYLVCNYLLYLRVSGQFHMACGMLHLFGHQLPETHHHYLLATGFTDYWRRINIYWKDFMVRVFFNPVVFRLKRWPQPAALAAATLVVFLATWGLHAYQSFWLRGTWGFSVPDALFWGILGLLVLINVQLDARRGGNRAGRRTRVRAAAGEDRRIELMPLAVRGLKTVGTFATIAVLWSLWSSPSLMAWLELFHRGLRDF